MAGRRHVTRAIPTFASLAFTPLRRFGWGAVDIHQALRHSRSLPRVAKQNEPRRSSLAPRQRRRCRSCSIARDGCECPFTAPPGPQGGSTSLQAKARPYRLPNRNNQKVTSMSANPDRFLRLNAVLAQTGLCRSTLYRKMADGTFPRSTQLSTRCIGWRASAIDEWMRNPASYDPAK
ncbi:helix-turn-helix transcriptional regulator [Sphingomonas sp. PB1R3]|uniref:helix-turn-helix transcriptional regulator n=2 Tax=Sphingomonadaceae TaxID=41297 RepID=UPI002FCB505A